MKVTAFIGSPRKNGNVDTLATEILNGVKDAGAEIGKVYLNDLNIKGCQACFACRYSGKCIINDDMTPLYKEIIDSDAIIIASSIFMWQMTGQTKIFVDRLFVLLENDYENSRLRKHKKTILVFSQAKSDNDLYKQHMKQTVGVLKKVGLDVEVILNATGVFRLGEVKSDLSLMKDAYEIGKNLINN